MKEEELKAKALLIFKKILLLVKLLVLEYKKQFCFVVVSTKLSYFSSMCIILLKIPKKSLHKRMEFDCGKVLYAINQVILKINQSLENSNLATTKKNLDSFLNSMNLLNQTLIG